MATKKPTGSKRAGAITQTNASSAAEASNRHRVTLERKQQQIGERVNFEEAVEKALTFREERDWAQFHNPKDLAISVSLEAAELLEIFQWSGDDLVVSAKANKAKEELADVVIYCIYLADALGAVLAEAVSSKIEENARKYPVDKSRGNARKYTDL